MNDLRAKAIEGMYCESAIKIIMEGGGGSTSIKILNPQGAVVGKGTLPHHSGQELIFFLYGDAATLQFATKVWGLLWSNGDVWTKVDTNTVKVETKVNTKLLAKRAVELINIRKTVGKAREACN